MLPAVNGASTTEAHAQASAPVRDAQAQANIRDKFVGQLGIPGARLTSARFNQIVQSEGQDAWGQTMLPETMAKMRTLISHLGTGDITARVKRSMAPGDSGTAGNILLVEGLVVSGTQICRGRMASLGGRR
jgi:hypothetical protein